MRIKLIPKIVPKIKDQDTIKQLDNLYQMVSQVITRKDTLENFKNGQILKDITIDTTNRIFPHSLGKEWEGYFVVKRTNANIPYHTATLTYDKKNAIELYSAASVIVDLYIF